MKVDPITLKYLLESMNEGVREMHTIMRAPMGMKTLHALARVAHKLRGEATVVGLANLSQLIISMENALEQLQAQAKIRKTDLQGLTIHLLKIVKVCEHIRKSAAQSRNMKPSRLQPQGRKLATRTQSVNPASGLIAALQVLANNVSRSYGKQVTLNLDKFNIADVPASMQMKIQDIVIQLVRNAIAHGVELPSQRKSLGKVTGGTVAVVARKEKNDLLVAVRDNGQGIDLEEIRRKLVIKYKYSVVAAANMSDAELLSSLFLPGFSTVVEQQQHAGRGVGLDLVKEYAYSLGGSVDVSFKENNYTQFVVRVPLAKENGFSELQTSRGVRARNPRIVVPTLTDIANL